MTDRTKLWIAEQMKTLMKKKPLSKIRITEICSLGEIERSTFYYHFRDKYDLVAWIFYHDAFETDVTDAAQAAESLKQIKNDILFYRRAYEDTSQNALWSSMLEYFCERYEEAAKQILHTDTLDTQLRFSIRLYCYGCVGMSREWILNDNITPAETAVQMMFASMPQSLQDIYFRTK